jgi:hypothetical protein
VRHAAKAGPGARNARSPSEPSLKTLAMGKWPSFLVSWALVHAIYSPWNQHKLAVGIQMEPNIFHLLTYSTGHGSYRPWLPPIEYRAVKMQLFCPIPFSARVQTGALCCGVRSLEIREIVL